MSQGGSPAAKRAYGAHKAQKYALYLPKKAFLPDIQQIMPALPQVDEAWLCRHSVLDNYNAYLCRFRDIDPLHVGRSAAEGHRKGSNVQGRRTR